MRTSFRHLRLCLVVIGGVAFSAPGEAQKEEAAPAQSEQLADLQAHRALSWFVLSDEAFDEAGARARLAALDICNAVADAGPSIKQRAVDDADRDRARAEAETLIAMIDFVRSAAFFTVASTTAAEAGGAERFGPADVPLVPLTEWAQNLALTINSLSLQIDAQRGAVVALLQDPDAVPSDEQIEALRSAARLLMAQAVGVFSSYFSVAEILDAKNLLYDSRLLVLQTADLAVTAAAPEVFPAIASEIPTLQRRAALEAQLGLGGAVDGARAILVADQELFVNAMIEHIRATEVARLVEECAGSTQIVIPHGDNGPWDLKGPLTITMPNFEGGGLYAILNMYLWGGDQPAISGDVTFVRPRPDEEGWDAVREAPETGNRGNIDAGDLGPTNLIDGTVIVWAFGDFADYSDDLELRFTGVLEENADDDGWTAHGEIAVGDTVPAEWAALLDVPAEPGRAAGYVVGTWSATLAIPAGTFDR
jgi:hypothetical protein